MKTFKRTIPDIKTSDLKNYSKYFNQMQFKGILEDDNIYAIDQESFRDTKNVYVDSNERLVSRPTLQKEKLPENAVPYQYELDDIVNTGAGTIYISKSTTGSNYYLVALHTKDGQLKTIQNITKYHISIIEHYIICFNDVGAKVFDTNESDKGWQDFNNFVEIPITKIIDGATETILGGNEFTAGYKEQYIYKDNTKPLLPGGTAEVSIKSTTGSFDYKIQDANELTDYKLARLNKYKGEGFKGSQSKISVAYNETSNTTILVIPNYTFFQVSYNGGASYTVVDYPNFSEGIPSIEWYGGQLTEDGLYYCFIAKNGIYFCNLGDYTWTKVEAAVGSELSFKGDNLLMSCFKTKEIFSFILSDSSDGGVRLYFKGPGLYMGTEVSSNKLGYIENANIRQETFGIRSVPLNTLIYSQVDSTLSNSKMKMFLTTDSFGQEQAVIAAAVRSSNNADSTRLLMVYGGKNVWNASYQDPEANEGMFTFCDMISGAAHMAILSGERYYRSDPTDWVYGFSFDLVYNINDGTGYEQWRLSTYTFEFTIIYQQPSGNKRPHVYGDNNYQTLPRATFKSFTPSRPTSPLVKLAEGYLYADGSFDLLLFYSIIDEEWKYINTSNEGNLLDNVTYITKAIGANDKYFVLGHSNDLDSDLIITNYLLPNDSISLTYTYNSTSKFTKVPKLSYSDTELYLAFDNLLQITQNNRDGTKILFNLPVLNNQSFIDNITAMINISTTEVALFFENKIVICSKVQDTNLTQGYRYDYYNTKLSTGVRYGDTVMNTLEGSLTIFPTRRGLAVMNYQAFMATTDQVIEYITDDIKDMWDDFFNDSTIIKIIQWRNRLIFTNQSNIILLYDLTKGAWWKWEVPVKPKMATTDQIDLKLVDTTLNIFKDAAQYYDFSEIGNFKPINWYVISQPLHMSAPNYYKNLRQLVFQFSNSDLPDVENKSMNAQIKLYRKKVAIKEPHTIQFKIENLRTFVKRFNYWKINEIQWALENDADTNVPKPFELNGISIKYELGDEVR